ncbi:hypothetical protein LOZ65_001911 [Ophidiomyces ophidiicola]|nr:hypothetical protein LOZ65_001911 [Ophidiomyces ophidiicola]
MGEQPSDDDNGLLQRLNALKPSSVQLEFGKLVGSDRPHRHTRAFLDIDSACRIPREVIEGVDTDEEDYSYAIDGDPLSVRFRDLGGSPAYLRSSHSVPEQEEDVENLLAGLRVRENWKLEYELEAENEINSLVDQAKKLVLSSSASNLQPHSDHQYQLLRAGDDSITKLLETPCLPSKHDLEEKEADAEAEDYVRKILDELRTPTSLDHDIPAPESPTDRQFAKNTQDFTKKEVQASDGSLALPSVPTADPITRNKDSKKKNIFTTSSESTPSWCCICNDNASLKCLDCPDSLLFCSRCWKEMHLVEGSEEERQHRAVEFDKRTPIGA